MKPTTKSISQREVHPPHFGARLVRALRSFQRLPGWSRLSAFLVPDAVSGPFTTESDFGWFTGDIASYIDKQVYLNGWYERAELQVFTDSQPLSRRNTILDIGANVGTHSIAFSRYFKRVLAFEPNPKAWPKFKKNLEINVRRPHRVPRPIGELIRSSWF